MSQDKIKPEITMAEQTKKFLVRNMYGFQTILTYGLGQRLGIFEYLYEKGKKSDEKLTSISFSLEELSESLNLDLIYLDAWLHLSIACGIFEIDESRVRYAKTAPYVYELLIDHDSMFFIGQMIAGFYVMASSHDLLIEGFKTGQIVDVLDTPGVDFKGGQLMSARFGSAVERLFAKRCKEDRKKILKEGANVIEIGCGYGFNLEGWMKRYKKAKFVGIDIDPKGIEHAKQLLEKNNWSDRVELFHAPLEDYVTKTDVKFEIAILNMVLHEMNPDDKYRLSVLENIYELLKDDGLLIVGDTMIPNTFNPNTKIQLYDVMHKMLEVGIGSKFYNEQSFKEFAESSSFKQAELIRDRSDYFWLLRK
ncbi:MAG: class I SAM-dependent methyltransferase [Promethearchaeota archaeon]|jgi:SAM-dependent methyltransferase